MCQISGTSLFFMPSVDAAGSLGFIAKMKLRAMRNNEVSFLFLVRLSISLSCGAREDSLCTKKRENCVRYTLLINLF